MSPIEQYLGDLDDELRVRLWCRRRILAEVREHLEQQATEARREQRMSQAQAEQTAIASFGSPRRIAEGFAAEAGGVLNRAVVTVSDLSYRVMQKPLLLLCIAWWPVALVALGSVGVGPDSPLWASVCGLGGYMLFESLLLLQATPRPGYVRRLRKLDPLARRQIVSGLRGGDAPSVPLASDVAAEVRQRVRELRHYRHISLFLLFLLLASVVVLSAVRNGEPYLPLSLAVVLATLLVGGVVMSRCDVRSARGHVASELEALAVVEEVAGEALRDGSARLQEQRDRKELRFELVPENPEACPLAVEVHGRALYLWAGPEESPYEFKRRDGDHLRRLALSVDAIVSGTYYEYGFAPYRSDRCAEPDSHNNA